MRKKKDGSYRVESPHGVRAKRTTKAKAKAQIRLLNAIEHGYDPDEEERKPKRRKRAAKGTNY
jgi:hypothetical protein